MTLVPHVVARRELDAALGLAPLFNRLIVALGRHPTFIEDTLARFDADPLVGGLMRLLKAARAAPRVHAPGVLNINRSDYMVDVHDGMKQIEINTIAAGFGMLSPRLAPLQAYARARFDLPLPPTLELPENRSDAGIPRAIAAAVRLYRERVPGASPSAGVAMIVQPDETNTMDQFLIEAALLREYGILCHRMSMRDVAERATVNDANGIITIDGLELAMCYYRTGYAQEHYPTDVEWRGRLMLETSASVQCPSVAHHLLTAKTVQQVLCEPGVVEQFLDAAESATLRSVFAPQYDAASDEAARLVAADADAYCLKPQREGGSGTNIFGGEAVQKAFESMTREQRGEYVLMKMLHPIERPSLLMRDAQLRGVALIAEIGIYGAVLADYATGELLLNESLGFLCRSKPANVMDGGIAAGRVCLDTLAVTDDAGLLAEHGYADADA